MSDDEIYEFQGQVFEWNRAKARKNITGHSIDFRDAATVYFDTYARFQSDAEHSIDEERLLMLGESKASKLMVVVHVVRDERIRIFSARPATASERRHYEENK
jgi:uncharacterized DUF497 family protein